MKMLELLITIFPSRSGFESRADHWIRTEIKNQVFRTEIHVIEYRYFFFLFSEKNHLSVNSLKAKLAKRLRRVFKPLICRNYYLAGFTVIRIQFSTIFTKKLFFGFN